MAGNVWEWTASEHEQGGRVVRGGACGYDRNAARCAYRDGLYPRNDWGHNGFRVVVFPVSPTSAL